MSEKKEALFSKKNKKLLSDPLNLNNPVTIQVLGICSALAVTVQMDNAIVMSVAVLFVMVMGNLIVSLLRNLIPSKIKIIVQLVIVAALVIIVDQVLKAYVYDVSKSLSVFVGLIITNCIIMGRLEAYALGNKPWGSILDGVGNGLGYGLILVVVAFFKELFGSGKLLGFEIFGNSIEQTGLYSIGYEDNGLMLLPPSSLILVAIYIWIQKKRTPSLIDENAN
ncbi:NADH:ubiquinone reductase (Na(+)-transporting) subunit D [Flavobacteriales bacterium]|jgi:Na+-transporting NADH:ubiquinone oxidoreductase subunit D|nr:NADH:ubiquinone reductase (Na(+)-transporting) subunit D [Flavobacteriales bacterium]MDB4196098.1 NADH:ubiquinone reductase (Na(+)-transporting) subunit D [Flavobacteriales bacterium]MDB9702204.1 NADH:ubiquinone reductase (Na(+)-transporting) subunit D [Flavobacteriales bacterium]MDC0015175.1 NADH:ubiquinone reductase (Na(+)-transporting) subunit D [Flavobacteriales bacterium]MDG1175245.1 NADH:ubiquinone reductase (Na(+)-transporting) subunit D [Flavobacteriales bacterium]|tara:strand:+ start:68 stop:736 length:669 start_codon:yes stop_codon:yes gene_type:complete